MIYGIVQSYAAWCFSLQNELIVKLPTTKYAKNFNKEEKNQKLMQKNECVLQQSKNGPLFWKVRRRRRDKGGSVVFIGFCQASQRSKHKQSET